MATNTNVDISKSLATLRAELLKKANPRVQEMAKARTTENTTYKPQINPSTYYSGGYSFADTRSAPHDVRVQSTISEFGKPLGEGMPNQKTAEGYPIAQLSTTGGRYAINPNDPTSVIYDPAKEARLKGYTPEAMTENGILRGGLSSNDFEIDHIMPLWLGGTDEVANKIILSISEHEKKTKVEAVARQLWIDSGKTKEGLDQARVLASTWRDKDVDDVEISDGKKSKLPAGYLIGGSQFAAKKLDAWNNPKPKLKDYLDSFFNTVTKKPIKAIEAAIGVPATAAAAAVTNLFMPEGKKFDPIKEASQYGSDIISGKAGMSNTPIFGKFSASTVKGFTGGWIDPETPEFTGVDKTIGAISGFVGQTAGFLSSMAAMKSAVGALTKIRIIAGAAQKAKLVALSTGIGKRTFQGGMMVKDGKIVDYGSKALRTLEDMGLFTAFGQLGKEGSLGTLLGANENSIKENTTRIMSEMAMGAITGPASHTWKGFAWVGSGTFSLSYLQSAADPNTTNEEDFKNAVSDGIMMMAFHSMGLIGRKKALAQIDEKANQWAQDTRDRLAKYGRNVETDPIPKRKANKIKTKKELNTENILIEKKIQEQVLNGTISQEQAYKYMSDNAVAGHQLWKGGLSRTAKLREDLRDWDDIGKRAKKPTGLDQSYQPPALVEYVSNKKERIRRANLPGGQDPLTGELPPQGRPPVGEIWFTDTTTQTTPLHAKNIARFEAEVEAGLHGSKQTAYIVPRIDKAAQVLDANKAMSKADIDAGIKLPYAEPEKNLGLYVNFADGTRGEVGYVPRAERIDKLPNNQNATIKKMNEARLAEGKKPFPLKDPNLNKNTIFDYMDNNGIPILETNIKIVRSKAINSGMPYAVGEINLNGWANSYARGKGIKGISEKRRLDLIENLKVRGIPASQVMKSMPVSMDSGELLPKGLVRDVQSHFTEAVETAVRTGNEPALRRTIEDNFGAIADDKLIKAIINKDIKTVGELWNAIGDAVDSNPAKLNDNGKFWQTGQQMLMDDLDYMAASVEIMDLPLDISPVGVKTPLAPNLPVKVAEPKIVYGQTGRKRPTGTTINAEYNRATNTITVDKEQIAMEFPNKPWTKPKVEGVIPLADDAFKTPQEWVDFNIAHEKAHVTSPKAAGESAAAYENRMNQVALGTAVKPDSGDIAITMKRFKELSAKKRGYITPDEIIERERLSKQIDKAQKSPGEVVIKGTKPTSIAATTKESLSDDLNRQIDRVSQRISNITLKGHSNTKSTMKLVDAEISEFERDFHYRYTQVKDSIKREKSLTPLDKEKMLDDLDSVFNKESLQFHKDTLRNQGLQEAEQVNIEGRKLEPDSEFSEDLIDSENNWKKNSGKKDTFFGNAAKKLPGHTIEHYINPDGSFLPKDQKGTRIDGTEYTLGESYKVIERLLKAEESRAKTEPILRGWMEKIKPKTVAKKKVTGDPIVATFWDKAKKLLPNIDEQMKSANYDTIYALDRQPKEVIDWTNSIRAKNYEALPDDALNILKTQYPEEVKSNEYIPLYPGSKLFKTFLELWKKNYDINLGEGTKINLDKQAADVKELIGAGKARVESGKVETDKFDLIFGALPEIKQIKSDEVKTKAVEHLARDFTQYIKSLKIVPKTAESNKPKYEFK